MTSRRKRRRHRAALAAALFFAPMLAWWYLNRPRALYTLADVSTTGPWNSTYPGYGPSSHMGRG